MPFVIEEPKEETKGGFIIEDETTDNRALRVQWLQDQMDAVFADWDPDDRKKMEDKFVRSAVYSQAFGIESGQAFELEEELSTEIRRRYGLNKDFEKLSFNDRMENVGNAMYRGLASIPEGALKSVAIANKDFDAAIPKLLGLYEDADLKDYIFYKAGEEVARWSEKMFPTEPALQRSFIYETLPQGFGQMVGFMGGGAVSKVAQIPEMLGVMVTGAMVESPHMYEDAIAHGATEAEAMMAARWGGPIGATEALPIQRIFGRFDRASGGQLKRVFIEALKGGLEEFTQESLQTGAENVVARSLYDNERELFDGMVESGGAGGILGFTLNSMAMGMGVRIRGKRVSRSDINDYIEEGQTIDEAIEKQVLPLLTETEMNEVREKFKVPDEVYQQNREAKKGVVTETTKDVKEIGRGVGELVDEFIGPISTRLANINPELKNNLRTFEYNIRQRSMEDSKAVLPLLEATKTMNAEDQADFDLARKNSDTRKVKEIIDRYGFQSEYESLRKTLDDIHARAKEVGFEVGYIEDYHPRIIKDPQGLLAHFNKGKDWPIIEEVIQAQEAKIERYLTVEEKAQIVNSLLRGYGGKITLAKPKAFKKRKIETVTADLNRFYMSSDGALISYVNRINEAIEARRFFGKGKYPKDMTNVEDSIGAYVLQQIADGKIRPDQEAELTRILKARFAAKGPGRIVGLYRDLSYLDTMGSPISAITQIGDLAWSLYNAGFAKTIKGAWASVRGKPLLKKEDIGIERIAEEFADPSRAAKAVQTVFKLTGLERIDRIGKEALIQSTIEKYRKQARSSPDKLRAKLSLIYGEETGTLINDLKMGEVTENVKLLAFNTLLDFQPVALSEMPEKYLTGGNGRIFYMLKTFTIKQFDIFRREAFQKMKQGQVAEGMYNLVRLAVLFALCNASADYIKDFMLGRKTEFSDRVVDNLLRIFGFSKFIIWTGRREGFAKAALKQILPPIKFIDAFIKDVTTMGKQGFETIQSIPLVGKFYYWWFGKGKKREEKRSKKKRGGTW